MKPSVEPAIISVYLDEDEAYSGTPSSEWYSIARQLEEFKSLKIEDIKPQNWDCEICRETIGTSDDDRPSEVPIEMISCGHVFGHICLSTWFANSMLTDNWWHWAAPQTLPVSFEANGEAEYREAVIYTSVEDVSIALHPDGQRRPDWRDFLNWTSDDHKNLMPTSLPPLENYCVSCPKCRKDYLLVKSGVIGVEVMARVQFWDLLYEKIGVTRSTEEEQSRTELLRYVQMVEYPKVEIK